MPASVRTCLTTSSLLMFCCCEVNPCFSLSENRPVIPDGSFVSRLDALLGSAFCSKLFETILMTLLACSCEIPTRCDSSLAKSCCCDIYLEVSFVAYNNFGKYLLYSILG